MPGYQGNGFGTYIMNQLEELIGKKYGKVEIDAAEADMNQKYIDHNGDCDELDNFYPMTAFNETGIEILKVRKITLGF